MTFTQLLIFLAIGAGSGWLAGKIFRGAGYGLVGNLIVGILGAIVGGYAFGFLGISAGRGILGSVLMSTAGALLLLFVLGILTRK